MISANSGIKAESATGSGDPGQKAGFGYEVGRFGS